jgi:hypothetical protein
MVPLVVRVPLRALRPPGLHGDLTGRGYLQLRRPVNQRTPGERAGSLSARSPSPRPLSP